jgi:hypothetical protein
VACKKQFPRIPSIDFEQVDNWPDVLAILSSHFPSLSLAQQATLLDQLPSDRREVLLELLTSDQQEALRTAPLKEPKRSTHHKWNSSENVALRLLYVAEVEWDTIASILSTPGNKVSPGACEIQFRKMPPIDFEQVNNWPDILAILSPHFPSLSPQQQATLLALLPLDRREVLLELLTSDQQEALPPPAPLKEPKRSTYHKWSNAEIVVLALCRKAEVEWDTIASILSTPGHEVSSNACQKRIQKASTIDLELVNNWPGVLAILSPHFPTLSLTQKAALLVQLPSDRRALLLELLTSDQQEALPPPAPLKEPKHHDRHPWSNAERVALRLLCRAKIEWDTIASILSTPGNEVSSDACQKQFRRMPSIDFERIDNWPDVLAILSPHFPSLLPQQQATLLAQLPSDRRALLLELLTSDQQEAVRATPLKEPKHCHKWNSV